MVDDDYCSLASIIVGLLSATSNQSQANTKAFPAIPKRRRSAKIDVAKSVCNGNGKSMSEIA